MINCKRKKVLMLVAGGTGGHIYPSLSLINKMKNFKFIIITDKRGKVYYENFFQNKALNFRIFTHNVRSPSNKKIIYKIISLFQILISLLKSLLIILFQKPNLAIGFGGYPSGAPILAAKICVVPSIIHEQNAVMGKTNRLLSYLTKNIALTFKNTKYAKSCSIHTGIPVRPKRRANRKSKLKRIFVVGGSQGA